jgi:hypothetical protein
MTQKVVYRNHPITAPPSHLQRSLTHVIRLWIVTRFGQPCTLQHRRQCFGHGGGVGSTCWPIHHFSEAATLPCCLSTEYSCFGIYDTNERCVAFFCGYQRSFSSSLKILIYNTEWFCRSAAPAQRSETVLWFPTLMIFDICKGATGLLLLLLLFLSCDLPYPSSSFALLLLLLLLLWRRRRRKVKF